MIRAIPRYCRICALLNQFCSLLSANTLISLRLNSSGLLLALETFNKEGVFIHNPFWVKKIFVSSHKIQKKPSKLTRVVFFMVSLGNLQSGPCILPSSTSFDLIPSYMDLFHLLQMLLCRSSMSTHISRFHPCEQPFFPSIWWVFSENIRSVMLLMQCHKVTSFRPSHD